MPLGYGERFPPAALSPPLQMLSSPDWFAMPTASPSTDHRCERPAPTTTGSDDEHDLYPGLPTGPSHAPVTDSLVAGTGRARGPSHGKSLYGEIDVPAIRNWSAATATRVCPPMISISTQTLRSGAIDSIVPTKSANGPEVRRT